MHTHAGQGLTEVDELLNDLIVANWSGQSAEVTLRLRLLTMVSARVDTEGLKELASLLSPLATRADLERRP